LDEGWMRSSISCLTLATGGNGSEGAWAKAINPPQSHVPKRIDFNSWNLTAIFIKSTAVMLTAGQQETASTAGERVQIRGLSARQGLRGVRAT